MTGIGREFIERTKYQHLDASDQMRGLPPPPLERPHGAAVEAVTLPDQGSLPGSTLSLNEAVERRRSVRSFAAEPISIGELSAMLWCTQGVKRVVHGSATMRTVPSAGARHAFETFLLVNGVTGVNPGLYRYAALSHSLLHVEHAPDISDRIVEACLGQTFVKSCAATFIWTAEVYRMTWRYGDRGYRYIFLDAGHVCQNLYLCAQSLSCGVCAVAAFSDDDMNRALGLDGVERFTVYLAAMGRV
jgi:SagB-type dehydrogenase family enzyme